MVKGYLEHRLTDALEANGLIENNRTPIDYKTDEPNYWYKKSIHWFLRNLPTIGITGIGITAAGAAAAAYYDKEILARNLAAGIGVASAAGLAARVFKPLHNWLQSNPEDIAQRYFLGVDVPWREAYDSLTIESKRELDGYVLLAQTANKIAENRIHPSTHLALGIGISKIADYLSELKFDSKLSGLTLANTIDMLIRQKVGTDMESKLIDSLRKRYSLSRLAKYVKRAEKGKIDINSIPGLPVLYNHLINYEFVLRAGRCDYLESIASQISKGKLVIPNDAGPNAGSYAGMHSSGKDFPRLRINDDAEHSLCTHASRILAVVGGNVEQGCLQEATGGIAIVEGTAEHHFGHGMDDSDWPAIGISVGGLTQRLDEVKNGLIISLYQDKLLRNSGEKPCVYRFRDGVKEKIVLPMGENDELRHEAPETLRALEIAEQYITEWARREKVEENHNVCNHSLLMDKHHQKINPTNRGGIPVRRPRII